MIEIIEVKTKKQLKEFVKFPNDLYKNCEFFVPEITIDALTMFDRKKNACFENTDGIFFLAYKDGKIVGRIAGLLQNDYNKINNVKAVRFTRFDSIDDQEVANALFNSVEEWAKKIGMERVIGPLGFNDLDREGLLIRGFDKLSTFETQYNYEYYQKLIENCGYGKDIDWVEYKIKIPEKIDARYTRIREKVLKQYNFKEIVLKNKVKMINSYGDKIFDLVDEAYKELYGVVPYSDRVRKQFIKSFKIILNLKYVSIVVDENDDIIGFGLAFPSVAEAVRDSRGKLLPTGIFKILNALKHPKLVDLALIAVKDKYKRTGLTAILFNKILESMIEDGVKYAETNLNLETNETIQAQWRTFEHEQHKQRRSFIKHLL